MELRYLQSLITVADEGSFTRASEKLFVSQPALSQQIRQLEEELGSILLDRVGRGVKLTSAGELFYRHAQRVFQELDEAKVALQELEGLQRGSLAVGVVQTINAYLIPQVVAQFANVYPAISLRIEEMPTAEIEEGLEEGRLQLGIGFTPPGNANINSEELFNEELVLIVSKEHELATQVAIKIKDLNEFPLVLLSKAYCTRRLWDKCAQQANIQPRIVAEMNTIGAIMGAVQCAKAGSILPKLALTHRHLAELVAISLREPTPQRSVGLLWRRNGYKCAATRAFSDIVKEFVEKEIT